MTSAKRSQKGKGTDSFRESLLFLFLPFTVSMLLDRTQQLHTEEYLIVLLPAALVLILLSASSVYAPLCLAAAFALLGLCAADNMPAVSPALLLSGGGWGEVLHLLPLFPSLFYAAALGLRRSGELISGGRLQGTLKLKSCVKTSLAQFAMITAGFAVSFFIEKRIH